MRVGVIIGKGGETIKYLQLQSGAKIQVTRDTEADLNSPCRVVELMGTSEQISKAEQLINDVLAEVHPYFLTLIQCSCLCFFTNYFHPCKNVILHLYSYFNHSPAFACVCVCFFHLQMHEKNMILVLVCVWMYLMLTNDILRLQICQAETGGSGIVARRITGQAGSDNFVMRIPNNKVIKSSYFLVLITDFIWGFL